MQSLEEFIKSGGIIKEISTFEGSLNREARRHPERYTFKEIKESFKRLRSTKEVADANAPYMESRISSNGTRYLKWRDGSMKIFENLTDNKAYMNKCKARAKEIGWDWLYKLAEIAHTKENPSHWFSVATSKANWERTKKMLCKLMKRIKTILVKIGSWIQKDYMNWLLKAQRQLGDSTFWEIARRAEDKEDSWAYFSHALNEEMRQI